MKSDLLSDIVHFSSYARFIPEQNRRETYTETVDRCKQMHIQRYPHLKDRIEHVFETFVKQKKVLPSMRSMRFAGKPIEVIESRIYNCAYLPIDDYRAFREVMFSLLAGTGLGFSVQKQHVKKLPPIRKPSKHTRYVVADTIMGWSDAVNALIRSYLGKTKYRPVFDYSEIRPKGTPLKTAGGKAPGPEPLQNCLEKVEAILSNKIDGSKLWPIEVHDIVTLIADAVLAGGIRRAALISLFSRDDEDMLRAKTGEWYLTHPHRGRANNSAVLPRGHVTKEEFDYIWRVAKESKSGEPGIFWTNDADWGTNPCAEVSLRPFQMCNLVEINASTIESQEDLEERARAAAFIATLQAGYTDFSYLRPIWRETTEREALIGVGATGIASGNFQKFDLEKAAEVVKEENKKTAAEIGINEAARCTVVKPAGTTSLILNTSSGIHAWHAPYYIRRVTVNKSDPLYDYLRINHENILEDSHYHPQTSAVVSVPVKAPDGAITKNEETTWTLLNRITDVYRRWIVPGHRSGANVNNISATVSVKDDEWDAVAEWMWEHREEYTALSVFPHVELSSVYPQLPFETITKERYEELISQVKPFDPHAVFEAEDHSNLADSPACVAGACEIV